MGVGSTASIIGAVVGVSGGARSAAGARDQGVGARGSTMQLAGAAEGWGCGEGCWSGGAEGLRWRASGGGTWGGAEKRKVRI